jgi:hypothetical protein
MHTDVVNEPLTVEVSRTRPAVRTRLAGSLRRHWAALALLGTGAVVRLLVMVAYPSAFLYTDSGVYVFYAYRWQPDSTRQSGYSLFLHVVRHLGGLTWVSAAQHLAGLVLVAVTYALAIRLGAARWLAFVAALPLALDPLEIEVEHSVLSDVMFTVLLAGGVMVLLWPRRVTWGWALVAGLMLAGSVATRVIGLAAIVLAVGYLLVRRAGWRSLVAFGAAAATPIVGYLLWFHHFYGVYGFSTWQGHFLYGRTATFADCDRLQLTPKQRELCPTEPIAKRSTEPGWYTWAQESPAAKHPDDATLSSFAMAVITQQPGDYTRLTAIETGKFFLPNLPRDDLMLNCLLASDYAFPDPPTIGWSWCKPVIAHTANGQYWVIRDPPLPSTPLTKALGAYGRWGQVFEPLLGLGVLLAAAALVWRPRRQPRREIADLLLMTGVGFGLLLSAAATASYHARYGLPAFALLPLAGTLAVTRLRRLTRSRAGTADVPADAEPSAEVQHGIV